MKKKKMFFLTIFLISIISVSALGASVSQQLRSRLTVLSAKLYNEVSILCPGEVTYQVALVPILDVNGEKPLLARYLHKSMEDVIGMFPAIRLASSAEVEQTWTALKAEGYSNQELFREMGQRLGVSALLMPSIVTHPAYYTLNATLVNTKTFEQRQLESTVFDRLIMDALTDEEILRVISPAIAMPGESSEIRPIEEDKTGAVPTDVQDERNQSSGGTGKPTIPATEEQGGNPPTDTPPVKPIDTEKETATTDNDEMLDVITEIITSAPQIPVEITPPAGKPGETAPGNSGSAGPGKSLNENPVEPKPPVQVMDPEPVKPIKPVNKGTFMLASESPLLNNLLLGFDLGDINGDGILELIYCGGVDIQARSLVTYDKLWEFTPYQPASRDYTILAVDLDGDKADEIIYHGNLLKLVENQLTNNQPRFLARPVSLYGKTGVALFNDNAVFVVNYQGLVQKEYPIGGVGKRFLFTDLEGDGTEELVVAYDGADENSQVKVFKITDKGAVDPVILEGTFGYSLLSLDLNRNGRPEIYLRKNFFNGVTFLYSKIYAFESIDGQLQLIAESDKLNYFIVDFAQYPKVNPDRLVVGTMNLQSKLQSITEIQSKLFFYTLQ